MIKEVSGDILKSGAEAIVHGIAPNDHFNQGLALAIRESWPALYKDFRHFCHTHHPKVGSLWTWAGTGGTKVVCLFTQEAPASEHSHPGKSSIQNVHHCFKELKKLVEKEGFKSLALPKVATGVGGLSESDVTALINEDLGDLSIPIYFYKDFKPGQKAAEQ